MTTDRTLWRLMFVGLLSACWLLPLHASNAPFEEEGEAVYRYRMKGKVRLLLFWVGKDDVGGGHIALRQFKEDEGRLGEQIEVLFGSRPERVPGGINRWGYGRETGYWIGEAGAGWELARSVFEGFLKHSKEESLDEVRAKGDEDSGEVFFDGVLSEVLPQRARSEIRTFSAAGDFDYRNADPVQCGYQRQVGQPADKKKSLQNRRLYQAPLGFLTAVRHQVREVLEAASDKEKLKSARPAPVGYVYHSRPYRLSLDGLRRLDQFELPLSEGGEQRFRNVAKAEFTVHNLEKRTQHGFTLWFPLEGPFAGIPIRIVDKPRWWLRVELNLEPGSSGDVGGRVAALRKPKCEKGQPVTASQP